MALSSRVLLQNHFTRGSQLCLLNAQLTVQQFSPEGEQLHKDAAGVATKKAKALGRNGGAAIVPAYRIPWVPRPIFDLNGHCVDPSDSRHPMFVGRGRLNYGWQP